MFNKKNSNGFVELEENKVSHSDSEDEELLAPPRENFLGAIVKMVIRILRAFRIDTTLYDELKKDPHAPSEANAVIIGISLLFTLTALVFTGDPFTYGISYFLSFFIGFYLSVLVVWLVGVKLTRIESTFGQVRTAIAYSYFPFIFLALPFPWNIISLWGFVTEFFAIRKTLGIGVVLIIVIQIGVAILDHFITPIIVPWLANVLFFWAISR